MEQRTHGGLATEATLSEVRDAINDTRSSVALIMHDHGATPVTTGAYTELVASTAAEIKTLETFDTSGEVLVLATGVASNEVDVLYIFPSGSGPIALTIPGGTRLSVRSILANTASGHLFINATG